MLTKLTARWSTVDFDLQTFLGLGFSLFLLAIECVEGNSPAPMT